MTSTTLAATIVALCTAACSARDHGRTEDGGGEADASRDAPIAMDGATDAGRDGGDDADAGDEVDAGADAGEDASVTDAGLDAATDAGVDAGTDAGLDAGTDAGPIDAGPVTCPSPLELPSGTCGDGVCGNGFIDSCEVCSPFCGPGGGGRGGGGPPPPPWDAGMCCTMVTETCDTAALGGATCTGLGFAAGTLACGSWCDYDTRGCDPCERGGRIAACTRVGLDSYAPSALALASTGTEIGVAWVSGRAADGRSGLRFARLDAALAVIDETECFGPGAPGRVALTATSRGEWLLAVEDATDLLVLRLDASGAVASARRIAGAGSPLFATEATAAPLLVYAPRFDSISVERLDADGAPMWTSAVFTGVVEPQYGSAVATADGYLVAMRTRGGVSLAPVSSAGLVGAVVSPVGGSTEYPQVTASGGEARLVWADFGGEPHMRWARVSPATGALIGASLMVGLSREYFNYAPLAMSSTDTLALMSGYSGGTGRATQLDFVRLSATGAMVGARTRVDRQPDLSMEYRMVRHGADVVVAWLGTQAPGRIGVSRLTP